MDDQWQRVRTVFHQALEQPEAERDAWLAGECARDPQLLSRLRALLAMPVAASSVFADSATALLGRLLPDAVDPGNAIGDRVGPYRLTRLLGVGGMGRVYLGERADGEFRHQVALKFLRGEFFTLQSHQRFLLERETLARLSHPNIAQLHDGGVGADGSPYFTLEFIDGKPLTHWCDERRVDAHGRVRLILKVCAAVEYAHRNLVVHRDLKPSNILVTGEGEPKLLDFGIAKLLDTQAGEGQTATQARMMTPEYAAPEQVLGDSITTATDVYSIGVLLYELLCGRMPYARAEAGSISWSKGVVEEMPESLGRALNRLTGPADRPTGEAAAATRGTTLPMLRRSLRGDLDRIVQRALAKQPESRYPSVIALEDDLRAFIAGRAISGGSRRYRLRKFGRRHWLPLTAAAIVLLTIVTSAAAIVWQARQTEHEARTTLAVKDFLFGLFTAVDPREAQGMEVSAHELLDRGAERIGRDRTLDQAQKAEIESALGRIYYQLGLFNQANKLQEDAIRELSANRAQSLLFAQAEAERADTLAGLGDLKAAAALASDASRTLDALRNASIADRARVLHVQARIALDQRDFAAAKRYADADLVLLRQPNADPAALFHALSVAGGASWGLTKLDDAESYYREALAVVSRNAGPDDLEVANSRSNIGMVLRSKSRYAEAELLGQQVLATREKVLGADHPVTTRARRDLALSHYHLGLYAQARAELERTVAAQRKKLGNEHPELAGTQINLGLVLTDSGDLAAAERVLAEAVSIFEKKYGREYQGTRFALSDLAAVHTALGKLDQAEAELVELKNYQRKLGQTEMDTFIVDNRLGEVRRLQGDTKSAVDMQRAALVVSRDHNGENSRYTAVAHQYFALALRDSGDSEGAESQLRAALASFEGYIPQAEHPLAATARYELGLLLIKRAESRAEGIRLLTEAADLREKFLGADNPRTKQAREALVKAQSLPKQ